MCKTNEGRAFYGMDPVESAEARITYLSTPWDGFAIQSDVETRASGVTRIPLLLTSPELITATECRTSLMALEDLLCRTLAENLDKKLMGTLNPLLSRWDDLLQRHEEYCPPPSSDFTLESTTEEELSSDG